MADETLGLNDYAKELKRWNAPYRYQEFPKMLFRGTTTTAGKLEVEQRIVASAADQATAAGAGWLPHPQDAADAETQRQEDLGTLAAERLYADRQLSPAAQAEAAAIDGATLKHLPEIPERPRRPRSHRKQPPATLTPDT